MYDRTSLDASGEFVINELPRRRADKISFSLFDSAKTNVVGEASIFDVP